MADTPIIHERFTSYQGSGALVGVRQRFIRFAGCAVKCPIRKVCDEQGALSFKGESVPADVLAEESLAEVGVNGWVQITGGEPCSQPEALCDLQRECTRRKLRVHIQTSGMVKVPCEWDWLTVSPKGPIAELVQTRGNEMVVVHDPSWVIDAGILKGLEIHTKFLHYYLQPLWVDGATNAVDTVDMLNRLDGWRLSGQMHKHMGLK